MTYEGDAAKGGGRQRGGALCQAELPGAGPECRAQARAVWKSPHFNKLEAFLGLTVNGGF